MGGRRFDGQLLARVAPELARDWKKEAAAAGFIVAAAWQWTDVKRRALVACHSTVPLAPSGWRADRDAYLFGWTVGQSGWLNCAPRIVACTSRDTDVVALAVCGRIAIVERYSWRRTRH